MYEVPNAGKATLLLFSAYVGLASLARQARTRVRYGALALLLMGTGFVIVAASSDAQGGLAILYVLPLQWLVAAVAGSRRFSASAG